MRVLFYEPNHTGHHYAYFARMFPGFLRLRADCPQLKFALATTQKGVESEEFQRNLSRFADDLEILPTCTPAPSGAILKSWHRCRELAQAKRNWGPDHVCLLYGDGIWQVAAAAQIFGCRIMGDTIPAEAWIYRGGFAYSDAAGTVSKIKRFLFRRLLQQELFDRIHFDDELLLKYVGSLSPTNTQVLLTPNPIHYGDVIDQKAARECLGLPLNGQLISSSGMITRWKGMDLVLKAFTKAIESRPVDEVPTRLLLAGPHEDEIRSLLKEKPYQTLVDAGQIISHNRYFDEQEMLDVASASDLVLAAYPKHSGRSSIILWAAAAGRPVLGVNRGCIAHVIEAERLGATCNVLDIEKFAKAINLSLNQPWTEEDRSRVRRYAHWHSSENYAELSAAYVRKRQCA